MRHSLDFGMLNITENMSDEEIQKSLPKEAITELEKTGGRKNHPVKFLIQKALDEIDIGDEFTVNDIYIMIHQNQKGILVKMSTLRTTLAAMARDDKVNIEVANQAGKNRVYQLLKL